MNLPRVSISCLLLLVFHCTQPPPSEKPPVLPLCELVAHPGAYDGKRVTVSGCVTTDGREYVALSNLENPCTDGGLVPVDAPSLRPAERYVPEPGKKVCGTFTGTFRASTALYRRVLEVETTANLQTSPQP